MAVFCGKGWISVTEIVLLNLLLDLCLVGGGGARFAPGLLLVLALAWLSVSRAFVLDFW